MIERLIDSPVGKLRLRAADTGLVGLHFFDKLDKTSHLSARTEDDAKAARFLDEAERQLEEYFAGSRRRFAFDKLKLRPEGTEFQRRVWKELLNIPYAQTISYGELAGRIGNPAASRAVGLANGRNPISVIVPCHRVIGSNGKLVGYGGGLDRKLKLLEIEGWSV